MAYEKTLVILKPDAMERKLAGRIISRLEDAGLDILDAKMVSADSERISDHYRSTSVWLRGVGEKTLRSFQEQDLDVIEGFGTDDPIAIGRAVKERLIKYMTRRPVLAMIVGGNRAVSKVRALAGYTIPVDADPGTIRGDFSSDSSYQATMEDRSVENLVHASGNLEEAAYEIDLWFGNGDAGK